MSTQQEKTIRSILLLAAVCALTVFVFLAAYNYDNKYTAKQPQAANGVLTLDAATLLEYPSLYLVNGWEYYDGKLLAPADFKRNQIAPDRTIYIGQYGGFEAGDTNASPHGSATYRLTIHIPEDEREYTLELPEIFSAYRAYINGEEVMRMGNPDPAAYRPETRNRTVTFHAGGMVEIIIAASDFSHLYSGLTYPPAFGEPEAVSDLLFARLGARFAVCATALTIGLLSVLIGLLNRSGKLALWYGLLCLCFVGYVSYPILHTFFSVYQPFYAIENLSFCAMLLLTIWIQYKAYGQKDRWSRYFLWFGMFCCGASVVLPLLALTGSLSILYGYSYLISTYQWVTAVFLTVTAIRAIQKKNARGLALLCGILVFDCALIMDRLLPLYEPIRTGWFIEIASFALVLAVGVVIGQEVAAKLRENAVLTERANSMERLSEMQQGYFAVLKQGMDETKSMRHDMRHHFTVMEGLLKNKRYDALSAYISQYGDTAFTDEPELLSENNVINILAHHYNTLSEQNRIRFDARCELSAPIHVSDADLCGVLSNLLENAVEACLRIKTGRRTIRLGFTNIGDDLIVRVDNSTDGSVKQRGDTFLSSKGEDREGYGLASVRAIAKRYDGTVSFKWDREKRLFVSIVVL